MNHKSSATPTKIVNKVLINKYLETISIAHLRIYKTNINKIHPDNILRIIFIYMSHSNPNLYFMIKFFKIKATKFITLTTKIGKEINIV